MKNSIKLFAFATFCLLSFQSFASDIKTVKIKGEIMLSTNESVATKIYVFEGNQLIDSTTTTRTGKFDIELPLGNKYVVELKQDGFLSKRMAINTEVSDLNKRVPNFSFLCELVKVENSIYTAELDFPVTLIKMNEKKGEFEFNSTYTKVMLKKYNSMNQQMSQKFEF
tara:strand:- start:1486 stop:1989 length:504 start_codon:yes stop_codon:yes gene_type:complete